MKRFIFGLLGFIVVRIVGLAPQFLAYGHVSAVVIFGLEGGLPIAGSRSQRSPLGASR